MFSISIKSVEERQPYSPNLQKNRNKGEFESLIKEEEETTSISTSSSSSSQCCGSRPQQQLSPKLARAAAKTKLVVGEYGTSHGRAASGGASAVAATTGAAAVVVPVLHQVAMSKLYVGNLPSDCNEAALRQLFQEHSLACTTILVKRGGYAFVDCCDQSTADRAIDKLNGFTFLGSALVVEPSVASTTKKRGSGTTLPESPVDQVGSNGWSGGSGAKILVGNLPAHVRIEDVEQLLSSYGQIQNFEKAPLRDPSTQAFLVSYETPDQAQQAASQLNGYEYDGNPLKVEMSTAESRRRNRSQRGAGGVAFAGGLAGSGRQTDFPLRILVQSDMVGAIIGRQGSTIRQITQMTRARVDVHRKDNVGSLEKAITIYGNPENCTNACKKILEVMHQEASTTNKGSVTSTENDNADGQPRETDDSNRRHDDNNDDDSNTANQKDGRPQSTNITDENVGNSSEITLKILAHNNLIGRIIGKGGNTIKRIMQDTDTKITVSSINDINSFNLERIITVKGTIENMSKAEAMISNKLRQSYENDLQAMAVRHPLQGDHKARGRSEAEESCDHPRVGVHQPQSMMFPGLHPMAMMSTASMGYSSRGPSIYSTGPAPYPYQGSLPAQQGVPTTEAQETTFLYIPNNSVGAIIGTKGSHIRNIIRFSGASVKIAPLENDKPAEQQTDRKVTIVGSPESQWKAQYLIFEKMREEGFVSGTEDVRLTVEILVPSAQVGRIIGKGGQNVRELQRVTGSVIKLSEQQSSQPAADEETTVHILGPFFSVQSAQRRIRAMVVQPAGAPGSMLIGGAPTPAGTIIPRAARGTSQEPGARSRRDGSATSQTGCITPQQQQSSHSSPSSHPSAQPQQSQ